MPQRHGDSENVPFYCFSVSPRFSGLSVPDGVRVGWRIFESYVPSAFRRTSQVRLKPDSTSYKTPPVVRVSGQQLVAVGAAQPEHVPVLKVHLEASFVMSADLSRSVRLQPDLNASQ